MITGTAVDQAEAMALGDRIVVMSHGKVAQIGTPRQIYIPAVEPVRGRFHRHHEPGPRRHLQRSRRDRRRPDSLEQRGEGEIEVLFRPENLTITEPDGGHLTGVVETAFFLGDRTRVIVRGVGDTSLVVETSDRHEFREGENVGLIVGPDTLMTMDGETP